MKPILRFAALFLLLTVNATVSFAQWEWAGGTAATYFETVGTAGRFIVSSGRYADNQPVCSKNGGESWFVSPGIGTSAYSPILVASGADTAVLAVSYSYSIFRLRDTAQTWIRSDSGLGSAQVRSLAYVGPAGSFPKGVVAAASPASGVFLSTDLGVHWSPSDSGLTTLSAVAIGAIDSTFLVGTGNQGVFRSVDFGLTWSPANSGLTDTSISALVTSPGWAFAASGIKVYQSSDKGETWSQIPKSVPASVVNLVPVPTPGTGNGMAIFAVTSAGYYRLSSGDTDWVLVKAPPSPYLWSGYLPFTLAAVDTVLYVVDDCQLICSTDLGKTWRFISDNSVGNPTPEYATGHKSSRYDHARLYLGQYASTNFGARWVSTHPMYNDGSHVTAFSVSPDTSAQGFDRLVVGTDSGAVEYSSDGGETWKVLRQRPEHPGFLGGYYPFDVAELDGIVFTSLQNHLYKNFNSTQGDTVAGVYRTTNEGGSWEKMNTPGLTDSLVLSLDLFHSKGGGRVLFAGTWYNLFRSTDDGASWMGLDSTYGVRSGRKRLREVNGTLFLCTEGTVHTEFDQDGNMITTYDSAGVYRSTDDGLTWTEISGNLKAFFVRGFVATTVPQYPGRVFLAVCRDGWSSYSERVFGDVLSSTEGGRSWVSFGSGLPQFDRSASIGADDRFLYCMGRRRLWSEAELTAVEPLEPSCPTRFSLSQNYPNPFNPTTTIRYALPHRSHVTLTLYNTLGQLVAKLINGDIEAGSHEVTFDAKGLASGVYFYRIQAGDFVQSKKLLLLK